MDRLAIILAILTGACVAGGLLIVAFALEYYSFRAIAFSLGFGALVAYPIGYVISRRIKREDPNWNHRKNVERNGILPDPDAPEV